MSLKTNLLGAGILLTSSLAASAATVVSYDFNSTLDGFTANNVPDLIATTTAITGTADGNDPQLLKSGISLSPAGGETWDTISFRVWESQDEAPAGPVTTFNPVGLIVTLNATVFNSGFVGVASGDDYFTVTLDISGFGVGTITSLRLDPIGGASANSNSQTDGNFFAVDYIRINDTAVVPEPSQSLLVGLAGVLFLIRRRK
ncbi:MAG: PEP-CTERM sorting domain-containing protein [Verrucomicrobiaceae bacterium]